MRPLLAKFRHAPLVLALMLIASYFLHKEFNPRVDSTWEKTIVLIELTEPAGFLLMERLLSSEPKIPRMPPKQFSSPQNT